jgi:hypothetical protein
LIAYFLYKFLNKYKSIYRILLLCSAVVLVFFGKDIIFYIIESGLLGDRYNNYLDINSTFGIAQFILYLPVFLMLFDILKIKAIKNNTLVNLCYIWLISGFTIALLGYQFGIIARASIYFNPVFVIFIPYYMRYRQDRKELFYNRKRFSYDLLSLLIVFYWIIWFILKISSIFITSELYDYIIF